MAKFYGAIGYAGEVEKRPGVWVPELIERTYRGDVVLDQRRWPISDKVNDDMNIDNSISIIADDYAHENLGAMRYIVWKGVPWKIQSFSIVYPRLVLQIGGMWNGERPNGTP